MTSIVTRWTYALALTLAATASAHSKDTKPEETKLKTVKARAITLQVPESWKSVQATSMRIAQFEIPDAKADAEGAELVVYYFGGGPTGGIRANVERWIGQFHEKERKVDLVRGKCRDGSYVLANISGTWKKPDGPPARRKTIDKPGSRVIGVILVTEKEKKKDYYFVKLSGPDDMVKSQEKALRTAFGAKAESEKPFKLADAEN